ncbi:retrovirus-related pol polyprotein from transposon TNT 1-94 [Tanacetum coccineum]
METIHVKFDELTAMASEHDSLEPISQRFINDDSSVKSINTLSKEDLDNLFGPMYEEYFEKKSLEMSISSAAQQVHNIKDSPLTSSIIIEENEAPPIVTTSEEQTSQISVNEADEFYQKDSVELDGNTLLTLYDAPDFSEAESSTTSDLSNMHEFYQVQPSTHIWTKSHPLEQVIDDPSKSVMTQKRLQTDLEVCMYALTVSTNEPKNIKEAMSDHSWIESMQDELHQFERLDKILSFETNLVLLRRVTSRKKALILRNPLLYQPDEFVDPDFPDHAYKLKKALYCLKQALQAWYDKLSAFLIEHHFTKGIVDPTLFTRRHGGDILLVQVYVDDIIFGSTNSDFSKRFANLMKSNFEMSMTDKLKFFLGLQVHQSPHGIFISQSQYAIELLKKHSMDECVSMSTPMTTERLDADLQGTPTDQMTYHQIIRGLMYLIASRPYIAFAIFVCAHYQARPTVKHLKEVKRIFRYLRQSYNMGLWYPKDSGFELIAYSDADHAGCKDDCKSTSGGIQFLVIIMAQLQSQADVSQDELCPPNKRYALKDANKEIDLDHPKELTLTLDDFRTIFHLPQATDNNHDRFVPASTFSEMVPFYINDLGFTLELSSPSNFKTTGLIMQMLYCFVNNHHVDYADLLWEGLYYSLKHPTTLIHYPRFTKLIASHYMTTFPDISRRAHDRYHNLEDDNMVKSIFNSGKHKDGDGMKILSWMITNEMKLTYNYQMYVVVFGVDVPMTQL